MITKGEKLGTLYLCTRNANSSITLAATGADTTLWHYRLEHMSDKGMQILHAKNLLPDLKQVDLDFCEHCVYGKQEKKKREANVADDVLQDALIISLDNVVESWVVDSELCFQDYFQDYVQGDFG